MDEKKTKRIEWIDFFRGIGILLMIMGHIGYGSSFYTFIHVFHMPMFFIVSGYFFHITDKNGSQVSFKEFTLKKAKSLIVPYFVFGLFHLIVFSLFNINNKQLIIDSLYGIFFISTYKVPIASALWFLMSLFFAEIFYYLICLVKNKKIKFLLVLISSLIGFIISLFVELPYGIDISLVAVMFLYVGSIVRENKDKLFNINIIYYLIVLALSIFFIYINGYVNLRTRDYSIFPLFYINSIVWSISLMYFSNKKCNLEINNLLFSKFKSFITSIGLNSITYVVLNQLNIALLNRLFGYFKLNAIITKISILPIVLLLLYLENKIINTKYLCFSIGKFKTNNYYT